MAFRVADIFQRLVRLGVSLMALITFGFLLIHLIPGDPARASLGLLAPQELLEARRAALGLDRPFLEQYFVYLKHLASGDLGVSFVTRQPVAEIIAQRLGGTVTLAVAALCLVMTVGIGIGMTVAALTWGGRRHGLDVAFNAASGFFTAMPEFVSAVALTALFAVVVTWLPVAGNAGASSYILPVLALSIGPTAALARIVRIEALRVLDEDYMRTARAKRLGAFRSYVVHALPNCLTATLTVSGLILSSLIAGTVLVESIFAWPGVGSAVVLAITQKDYPLTQGIILVLGGMVLLINFAVDLMIMMVDPRSDLIGG